MKLKNLETLSNGERLRKPMALTGGPFGPGNPTGPWGPWGPWKEKAVEKFKTMPWKIHLYTLLFISTDEPKHSIQLLHHNDKLRQCNRIIYANPQAKCMIFHIIQHPKPHITSVVLNQENCKYLEFILKVNRT